MDGQLELPLCSDRAGSKGRNAVMITLPSLPFITDWVLGWEVKENGPFNNVGRMLLRIKISKYWEQN